MTDILQSTEKLVENYGKWVVDQMKPFPVRGARKNYTMIRTGSLDRHNDILEVCIWPEDNSYKLPEEKSHGYKLSDNGYVLDDLQSSGFIIANDNGYVDEIRLILNGLGADIENGEITVYAIDENFSVSLHSLIQAMVMISNIQSLEIKGQNNES